MRPGCLLFLLLSASCATTSSNSSGIFATEPHVLFADESGQSVTQPDGQPLRSGQVFALSIELQQPAHVYVIHRRGGMLSGLYPGVGEPDVALSAGLTRLPSRDTWMRVPTLEHHSRICVLLSEQPLDPQLRRCPGEHEHPHGSTLVQPFLLRLQ